MAKLEKITFNADGEDAVDFYVLEQTRIAGISYILVTDVEEGDGEALILKDLSQDGEEERGCDLYEKHLKKIIDQKGPQIHKIHYHLSSFL